MKRHLLNFEYSIDFIYIIGEIIESETKKNNTKFDDIKKLELDLFIILKIIIVQIMNY